MSEQFEGAPLPYNTLEIGAHTASGGCQIYLTDINGRKIGCVWGKADEKAFTAHLLATAASSHNALVTALEAAIAAIRSSAGPEERMNAERDGRALLALVKGGGS